MSDEAPKTLREHYQEAGFTRRQLADATGLSERTIYRLEIRETASPQWRTIHRISRVLKRPVAVLFPGYWQL